MQYEDYQTMGGDQYDHIKFSKAAKFLLHLWEIFITLVEKLHVCYTCGNFSVTLVGNFFVTLVGNFITLVGIITLVGKFITLVGVITSKKFHYTCGSDTPPCAVTTPKTCTAQRWNRYQNARIQDQR